MGAVAPGRRLSILVVIQGELGERLAGPAVRGSEMAKVLARHHRVTAAVPGTLASGLEGVRVVPFERRTLLREARRHDAVIAPTLPPYLLTALAGTRVVTVADQYCPAELEHGTLGDDPLVVRGVQTKRAVRLLQLRYADVVTAANDAQRARLAAELELADGGAEWPPRVVTLPFGLPDPPPPASQRPLRQGFHGIRPDDFVILWWGNIWPWFDAPTALRAFARVARLRPQAKLVLSAGRPPRSDSPVVASTARARELAAELALLGRSVHFLEDWVPYSDRHAYLQDADLGFVLHGDTAEARVAARSRYLDYIWCGTPCVLARGDDLAREMGDSGFAELVPPRDAAAAGDALLRFIDEPARRERARAAAPELAERYRWPTLMEPLLVAIEQAVSGVRRRRTPRTGVAVAAARYYARRLGDRGTQARHRIRRRTAPAHG